MKITRFGRVLIALIVLVILAIVGYITLPSVFKPKFVPSLIETLPDGLPIKLPEMLKTPATMSDAEREAAIEQARQDAMEAARVTGQDNDHVQKIGDAAAKMARKAFYPNLNDEKSGN